MSPSRKSESQERPRKRERIELTNDDQLFEQWCKDHPYEQEQYDWPEEVYHWDENMMNERDAPSAKDMIGNYEIIFVKYATKEANIIYDDKKTLSRHCHPYGELTISQTRNKNRDPDYKDLYGKLVIEGSKYCCSFEDEPDSPYGRIFHFEWGEPRGSPTTDIEFNGIQPHTWEVRFRWFSQRTVLPWNPLEMKDNYNNCDHQRYSKRLAQKIQSRIKAVPEHWEHSWLHTRRSLPLDIVAKIHNYSAFLPKETEGLVVEPNDLLIDVTYGINDFEYDFGEHGDRFDISEWNHVCVIARKTT